MASFSVASKGPGLWRSVDSAAALGSIIQAHTVQPGQERPLPTSPPTPPARRAGDTPATTWSAMRSSLARSPFLREMEHGGPKFSPKQCGHGQDVWTHKALDTPQLPRGW